MGYDNVEVGTNEFCEKLKRADTAFPVVVSHGNQGSLTCGLSKREYFAAKAMQALAPPFCEMTTDLHHERNEAERVARWAVIYADALIDALKPSDSEAQG